MAYSDPNLDFNVTDYYAADARSVCDSYVYCFL